MQKMPQEIGTESADCVVRKETIAALIMGSKMKDSRTSALVSIAAKAMLGAEERTRPLYPTSDSL